MYICMYESALSSDIYMQYQSPFISHGDKSVRGGVVVESRCTVADTKQ